MAKIDWTKATAVMNGGVARAKIGNNRELARGPDGSFRFLLHGHAIATLTRKGKLVLNPCGQPTITTNRAMQDAAKLFGFGDIDISFAKGRFTAAYDGVTYLPDPKKGGITITAIRQAA